MSHGSSLSAVVPCLNQLYHRGGPCLHSQEVAGCLAPGKRAPVLGRLGGLRSRGTLLGAFSSIRTSSRISAVSTQTIPLWRQEAQVEERVLSVLGLCLAWFCVWHALCLWGGSHALPCAPPLVLSLFCFSPVLLLTCSQWLPCLFKPCLASCSLSDCLNWWASLFYEFFLVCFWICYCLSVCLLAGLFFLKKYSAFLDIFCALTFVELILLLPICTWVLVWIPDNQFLSWFDKTYPNVIHFDVINVLCNPWFLWSIFLFLALKMFNFNNDIICVPFGN